MRPIKDVRRSNLLLLVEKFGQAEITSRLGKDRNQVYQWTLEPSNKAYRGIGDNMARAIEEAFQLQLGAMDHPMSVTDINSLPGHTKAARATRLTAGRDSHFATAISSQVAHEEGPFDFSTRLSDLRKKRGMTQEQLGKACGYSGQSRIANYEAGTRAPALEDLPKLAKVLNVSVAEFFLETESSSMAVGSDVGLKAMSRGSSANIISDDVVAIPTAEMHRRNGESPSLMLPRHLLAASPLFLEPYIQGIVVTTDALAGEIELGSIVFVDTRITHIENEGIYAFVWARRPMIKWIRIIAADAISLRGTRTDDIVDLHGEKEQAALKVTGLVVGVLPPRPPQPPIQLING